MILYLMRHGIAADPRGGGRDADARRPLTPEGRTRTARIAEALNGLGCRPTRIWSSPLLRAMETAQLVAAAVDAKIEEADFLAPDGDPQDALRALLSAPTPASLMVGHMPDIAMLAAYFLPGLQPYGLLFKKAAVAEIEFDGRPAQGGGRLNWIMQPRQLLRTLDPSD